MWRAQVRCARRRLEPARVRLQGRRRDAPRCWRRGRQLHLAPPAMRTKLTLAVGAGASAAAWGHFEAGWLRLRAVDVELPRLPHELDGVRIVHLSDFHLGLPSRGARAVACAVEWARERRPELVCITGDLVSRPRGGTYCTSSGPRTSCWATTMSSTAAIRSPGRRG